MKLLNVNWASLLYIKFLPIVRMLALVMRFILELLRKEFEMNAPVASERVAGHVSRERLMEDMRAIVADTEELLKATANQSGVRVAAARSKVGESLQIAKARLAEAQVAGVEKIKVLPKATGNYMQINSCQPMDAVAALGLALGMLNSRR